VRHARLPPPTPLRGVAQSLRAECCRPLCCAVTTAAFPQRSLHFEPMLIDSHAHLAADRFDPDRGDVLARAWAAGLTAIVVIGETPEAAVRAQALAATDPTRLFFTAGMQPHDIAEWDGSRDLPALEHFVEHGAVAIGECGLDYHYDSNPRERQRAVFADQLELAARLGAPVVVHTRDAEADTAAMMHDAAAAGVHGVLHCFTGTAWLAEEAMRADWYVSLSGIATFRNWQHDDVVRLIREDRLLVETDAPYLAPIPMRGKRNEPAFVAHTVAHLAGVRGAEAATLGMATARNAQRLFRLPVAA
jgi:TatD DNase family protein